MLLLLLVVLCIEHMSVVRSLICYRRSSRCRLAPIHNLQSRCLSDDFMLPFVFRVFCVLLLSAGIDLCLSRLMPSLAGGGVVGQERGCYSLPS